MKWYRYVFFGLLLIAGCSHSPSQDKTVAADPAHSGIARLAKSDIDEVIELHQRAVIEDLKQLMIKLYKRNPAMRQDRLARNIKQSVDLVFTMPIDAVFPDWKNKKGTEIIHLAFDKSYHGDRIFALIVGLRKMLMAAYDNQTEFYFFTKIDAQKLYHSARNIEIAAWLLGHARDQNGHLLILSDSIQERQRNLSFQRLIGKMIATQDNLANIIAHKTGRVIKSVVVNTATFAFFPL